ncbi:MAG TPA: DUF2236 domain-containing protein, partial [Nocardioides sp.]|nr:DUF2236 domain-containing protein [Nocardioides sp.]
IPPVKALHTALAQNLQLRLAVMKWIAPAAVDVAAPAILGIPPVSDKVWEVREAQKHFGFDAPFNAHKDVRAKQRDRVFTKGLKPSDDGLIESQQHIGSMDVHNAATLG